jgi:hypothetical protein
MPQTPPTSWMLADSQARNDGERMWKSWLLSLGRKVRGFVLFGVAVACGASGAGGKLETRK